MSQIPKDPFMLLSYLNTQLRDNYSSLDEFCHTQDADRENLEQTLAAVGYRYDEEKNQFR
ncbi:MAG: DUF4250 domain-containing protein [Clostridiales bacterium]|nr:DUF4250 domain-containing protein [Clostridiales bacterium]